MPSGPVTVTVKVQELAAATVPPARVTMFVPAVAVATPPQVLASPLGVATINAPGKVSVNATPVRATVFAAGLVMVKVSVVLLPTTMIPPNALAMEGGATTAMEAEAVPPVPPCVDVTLPVVLFLVPPVVPVTFIANVQDVAAARLAPVRLMLPAPAVAVMVPPPQLPTRPLGVETTRPAGRVAVNPTPVSVVPVLLFWMVNVKLVEPPSGMLAAPNALMITGGATTVMEALDVLPGPPSVEVTCTLLFLAPAVVPVTFTLKVHEALVAKVAPASVTLPEPAVAVIVPPPHDPVRPFGVATTRPAGSVSVNATPVRGMVLAAGFVIVKLKLVEPFSGIVAAPNALVMVGGVATARFAVAVLPVPPLVDVTLPVVLTKLPEAVPVTFTVTVQLLLAAIVPPVSEM